ncbi:PLC-like phosphodiesterase [Mytilinidion resinicola]|uniref:PLC-like phosphodiesterase n=1 Tax=Mytilinidion resinicola TaxID=574789 RepID=A0A6A6Y768_9PEZI|nr:PLC-like phosphodiesterase [Mytilinidion resinicola]KAF2804681.1 PLC-like phosphodiesterase [Mytilinidion resinicola]
MPSKGIQCYAYIGAPGCQVEFSVPKTTINKHDLNNWTQDHLEVDQKNLGSLFHYTGRFSFRVSRDGRELTNQWVEVNSLTGDLEDGTMKDMQQTPSILTEDVIITYSFYDAGPGVAGLPKQHQCAVSVTPNHSDWIRDVAPIDSPQADKPFHRMVLPSSHDIGMNSMTTSKAMLHNAGTNIIKMALGTLPGAFRVLDKVSDSAINAIAPNIIYGLAITQKDSLSTILAIGARYFEFRPAHCHREMQKVSPLPDTLYFQHGAIPGMPYAEFLHDIVQFLNNHREEIVVAQLRWDGVPGDCPRPSDQELSEHLDKAREGTDIQVGNLDDMRNKTIKQLRQDRQRLILIREVDQASNYDDKANATLDGATIVTALDNMSGNPPRGKPLILLQCQATATNIPDVIAYSVLSSDVSTSPLLATKPICDIKTLPTLRGDVGKSLTREDGAVAIMNDFFEGGTAEVAIGLSRDRLR